ncbi:MAG: phage integrase SAM-like domain-containing protein, partial [Ferruginibacter sp.]|nr:phage integrase SAM-like domain-containing protein [Cytophagales bacterium]
MDHTFTVLFWINRARTNKKGEVPIYARITVDGKRAEIATGCSVEGERWNAAMGSVKGNKEDARSINAFLETIMLKLNGIHRKLIEQNELISAEAIKSIYFGKTVKRHTLMEVFDHHNRQMASQVGKDYALGTLKRFETVHKLVREFIRHRHGKSDLHLSELNHEFVTDLEFHFKTVRQCAHNTTMKYITNLRK